MDQRRTPSGQGPSRRNPPRKRAQPGGPAPARSASRPAAARRAAGEPRSGAATRAKAPRPQGRFSGRAAILALVLVALLLAYAYPVRVYFRQQAEIALLEQRQAAQSERIKKLEELREKWEDPEYVRAQARRRLQYVRPDEVTYVVIEDPAGAARDRGEAPAKPKDNRAWFEKAWSSVQSADKPG